MIIDIITLFPEMCERVLSESIIGRARKNGKVEIACTQLRDYAFDKHRRVDDTPYGGGMGMVMMCEPIALCFEDICKKRGLRPHFIYMSPKGNTLTQETVKQLSDYDNICILCGHYEGVDQRVLDEYIDEEISIGDYVLTGGELPALILADSISRMLDGVLSDSECFEEESHYNGLLEYPQYTKPQEWHGVQVPEVLVSGHHENVKKWRRAQSLMLTKKLRPDLYSKTELTKEDKKILSSKLFPEEKEEE
ncbi:MAG: tRNA (guanosine(37)-N1)-methyltransferase TrmD [Clostridiales bacterium]|nr:tRNA (guanosine(37)-N1)-methyltransferase TrmD [Clostridiales bacterium]